MSRPELHETLGALIEALDAGGVQDALRMVEAEITVPFEVVVASGSDGLVAYGAPPLSRFESGVMHPVHRVFVRAVREDPGGPE